MILALFSTLIGTFASILWKKSLSLTQLSGIRFLIFGYFGGIVISIILLALGKVDFSSVLNIFIILAVILMLFLDVGSAKLEQEVYKTEKYSALVPFENLEKIFIVIIGFFLFHDSNLNTLLITLFTIFVIIIFNIDFKNFSFPKYIGKIFILNGVRAAGTLITGFVLKKVSAESFFVINQLTLFFLILLSLLITMRKSIVELLKQDKNFYYYRLGGNILWASEYLITLFLISELGIVVTILLSFFSIALKMIFSYIILKEVPGKKDIILSFLVVGLISLGYYFS